MYKVLGLYDIISHGLMQNVHDFSIRGSRLKCSGYRIKTKTMQIIKKKCSHFRNKKKKERISES
jgi:hypothetical protein